MAKYEDYVKADGLENEIDEAGAASEQRQQEEQIPERFRGKSAVDIAKSYAELEASFGRQANELGTLRKTVDNLVEIQTRTSEPAKPVAEKKPVTVDEIYDNADESIRRVVREESTSRIDELEKKLEEAERKANMASARATFEVKHPDYKTVLADDAFKAWVVGSTIRKQLAAAADQGNFDAADELFSTYAELKAVRGTQTNEQRRAAVRGASLESSGGSSPAPVEKFSRAKLTEMRIKARHGSREAESWLLANGDAIQNAYAEGRLVN
jgi:hypothetical protein